MYHPMVAQLGNQSHLDGLFDDFYKAIKQSGQQAIDEGKAAALASTAMVVMNEPAVQKAVLQQGEKAAYQKLIDNLVAGRQALTGFVQENPYKTVMVVGGVVIGAGLLIYMMRR